MRIAFVSRIVIALAAALVAAPAGAPIVTHDQLCARGDRGACRLAQIENGRDFRRSFGEGSRYRLVLGPKTLWSMLSGDKAKERPLIVQSACTFYNEVELGPDIEEYERSTSTRTVDSDAYQTCLELLL